MASPVHGSVEKVISSDLTVRYGWYPSEATPVVVQSVLHEAGRLFTGSESAKLVTLFDACGRPALASVESESLTLTHGHLCFTETLLIAAQASVAGDLGRICDLIGRVQACKDKYQFHLDNHSCLYQLKYRPAHSSSVSERSVNVRGVVENHCSEHESILSALRSVYLQGLEIQGLCRAPLN